MRRTAIRLVLLFSVVSTGAIVFQNCAKKSGDFVVQSSSAAGPAVSGLVDTPITWGDSPGNGDLSFVDLDPDDNPNNLKKCPIAFASESKSIYVPADSISIIFATTFKVESNYTIEWSGTSPSGYTKLAEEVTRLQSDLNGMEAYKANRRTVSVLRSSSEAQLSTGSYTRSLKIKDGSGAVLCESNQVFFTVSPHTCELGLAGDSFIVDSPLQFELKSSDALPNSFSAQWADSMRNVISSEDHAGLQSAVVSQAMNMTTKGIVIEKRFSEVKENITRSIVIKEGDNIWCNSPIKKFNIIEKPVVIGGGTGTGNGTGTGTGTGTGNGTGGDDDKVCPEQWVPLNASGTSCTPEDAVSQGKDTRCYDSMKAPSGMHPGDVIYGDVIVRKSDGSTVYSAKLLCGSDLKWSVSMGSGGALNVGDNSFKSGCLDQNGDKTNLAFKGNHHPIKRNVSSASCQPLRFNALANRNCSKSTVNIGDEYSTCLVDLPPGETNAKLNLTCKVDNGLAMDPTLRELLQGINYSTEVVYKAKYQCKEDGSWEKIGEGDESCASGKYVISSNHVSFGATEKKDKSICLLEGNVATASSIQGINSLPKIVPRTCDITHYSTMTVTPVYRFTTNELKSRYEEGWDFGCNHGNHRYGAFESFYDHGTEAWENECNLYRVNQDGCDS